MRAGTSKNAVAQKRMYARDGFGCIKRGRARRHSIRGERRLRRLRDWLLRERMRQRFERSVVLEREMRPFVRFNQDEARGCVIISNIAMRVSQCSLVERQPMRICESRSVPMPCAERRQVVAFSSHFDCRAKKGGTAPSMRAS